MHRSRLGALIIDCRTDDLHAQARFWSEALGAEAEAPGEQVNDKYIRLERCGEHPRLLLQKVDHPSRVHIDIATDNIEAEVRRLCGLGATVVDRLERWVVMEAPTGHRFCVIGPSGSGFAEHANPWG